MNRLCLLAALVVALPTLTLAQTRPTTRPNVVLIVVDDLGSTDVGFMGGRDVKTPHLDALAAGGVRFTNAYVSCPVCSPSRAGLLTGRYQQRFGHEQNPLPSADNAFGLPLDQRTLADDLRAAGYRTAHIGKWHLGNEPAYFPLRRGFDESFGFLGGMRRYINSRQPDPNFNAIRRGDEAVGEEEYLTDAFSREAVAFIDRNRDRPFFLYLPYNAPHTPLQAPPKYRDRFADVKDDKRMRLCAMMAAVDDGVGQIDAALRRNGIERDTLVIFLSDNGGPPENGSSNAPFRGTKGETFEGGIRVPFVLRWPGGGVPAAAAEDRPMIALDIAPTALAAAGARRAADAAPLDGRDLVPFVTGKAKGEIHPSLYWRFGPRRAIRSGDWKLQWEGDGPRRLFDLKNDKAEANDLAAKHADVVDRLSADWAAWNATLIEPRWPGRLENGGNTPDGTRPATMRAQEE